MAVDALIGAIINGREVSNYLDCNPFVTWLLRGDLRVSDSVVTESNKDTNPKWTVIMYCRSGRLALQIDLFTNKAHIFLWNKVRMLFDKFGKINIDYLNHNTNILHTCYLKDVYEGRMVREFLEYEISKMRDINV